MNLPSRGLRLSATTMRNTGLFFAPIRFIRILTAINQNAQFGLGQMTLSALRLFRRWFQKRGEAIHDLWGWQAPFFGRLSVIQLLDGPTTRSLRNDRIDKSGIRRLPRVILHDD